MKAYALKAQIRSIGCELTRIGHSRNWKLVADREQVYQLITFIEQSDEPSWLWLAKFLGKQQQEITLDELKAIALQNSGITVNQLMARTDCTVAQARKVIDDIEFID